MAEHYKPFLLKKLTCDAHVQADLLRNGTDTIDLLRVARDLVVNCLQLNKADVAENRLALQLGRRRDLSPSYMPSVCC
ncbi:MAG TPA: hypothetical protein VGP72_02230 [Planctomycetota bacterium]|jgi:hypothetical protein